MPEPFTRAVQVECYSGYTYAQEPRAFVISGRRHEITRITARWRTPSGPAFRIESPIGEYVLYYHDIFDVWTLASQFPMEWMEEQSGGEEA
ncbi:MAG: hypothetical protein ACUVT1_14465 [Anaerolineae bacterium]